jgi:phosphatidylglycerophosphatase A
VSVSVTEAPGGVDDLPGEGVSPPEAPISLGQAFRSPAVWIATACGFGYAPIVSGTFGSAAGVLLFWALSGLTLPLYVLTVVTLSCLGVWASDRAEQLFARKDDGRIVIDEVAGQLITLLPVLALGVVSNPAGAVTVGVDVGNRDWWVLVVTGFVLFRVFDIWKPGPVRWAERNFKGGLGVMADDLLAGVFSALILTVPCYALVLARLGS